MSPLEPECQKPNKDMLGQEGGSETTAHRNTSAPQKESPACWRGSPVSRPSKTGYLLIVDPGAGVDDGIPPGVVTVGLVPAAVPLFVPVVLVPLPVLPVLAEPALPAEPAAPAAAPPPAAPPPAPPPACASAMDELIARIEAKTAVVIFMEFSFVCI